MTLVRLHAPHAKLRAAIIPDFQLRDCPQQLLAVSERNAELLQLVLAQKAQRF